jgi:hypothetical protein
MRNSSFEDLEQMAAYQEGSCRICLVAIDVTLRRMLRQM